MSCSGCRALRRGCSHQCILRPCLDWIQSPQAQANATLFVSKFYGRAFLMSFISAVPENERPALFQSLLFEACGRVANPVNGAVGLLYTGNWHVCQAAVEAVLCGRGCSLPPRLDKESSQSSSEHKTAAASGISELSPPEIGGWSEKLVFRGLRVGGKEPKLLNLFA